MTSTAIDTVELRKFTRGFDWNDWPEPTCPACGKGRLVLEEKHLRMEKGGNAKSQELMARPEGSPFDISGVFHAELHCNRKNCGDWVAVTGDYFVDQTYDTTGDWEWGDCVRVRTMYPAIDILTIPKATPDKVATNLRRAAALVWMDPSSAVSALRTALERLMDEQGIKKMRNLHRRIESYRDTRNEKFGKLLLAVKYVGNSGTHTDDPITSTDAIDMAEFIEIVIISLYEPADDHSSALVRADRIIAAGKLVD